MSLRHVWIAVVLAVLAAGIVGCRGGRGRFGGTAETTIYHPSRVPPNGAIIVARDSRAEQQHGLGPGTLADTAEMIYVDPTRVCVRVSLWAMQDDLHRADYARYEFSMRAADGISGPRGTRYEPRIRPVANLQVLGAQDAVHAGRETVMVANGLRDRCVFHDNYGNCTQWSTDVTHRGVQVNANLLVRNYVADMCFANQGLITDGTQEIALEMRERRRARQFVWHIDPSVPQQQPAAPAYAAPQPAPVPNGYVAPQNGYVAPGYVAPQNGYVAPQNGYVAPGYVPPQNNSYVAPPPAPMQPSNTY